MGVYGDRKGKNKPASERRGVGESYEAPFVGYINVTLSDDQKGAYEQWASSASFWDMFEASVADGVQISTKLDPKGTGFLASATQRRVSSPNAGCVVTARARNAQTALGRLLFTLAYLSHAEVWTDLQPLADPDRW